MYEVLRSSHSKSTVRIQTVYNARLRLELPYLRIAGSAAEEITVKAPSFILAPESRASRCNQPPRKYAITVEYYIYKGIATHRMSSIANPSHIVTQTFRPKFKGLLPNCQLCLPFRGYYDIPDRAGSKHNRMVFVELHRE